MANTKISALTANTNPNWSEEFVYAYNNANGKITLDTMKTFASADSQATLVSGVNIKTINNTSILWSGNIDVSWWGGWSWSPTELGGDANIWELSEWVYVTTYDLYYMSWQRVPRWWATWFVRKQMLFVAEDSEWGKWYFVFNVNTRTNIITNSFASFGHSASASDWDCAQLWNRDFVYRGASLETSVAIDAFSDTYITQIIHNISWQGTQALSFSQAMPAYKWLTYTIYIDSVASAYSITLWTWVTNPLNISLPTESSKWCVITVLATSTTTWIVTSCQMLP